MQYRTIFVLLLLLVAIPVETPAQGPPYNRLEIIGKTNWQIQLEDQLPTSMNVPIFIPKHEWHRVIKGEGKLTIKIHK